jgi:hypothetical protein
MSWIFDFYKSNFVTEKNGEFYLKIKMVIMTEIIWNSLFVKEFSNAGNFESGKLIVYFLFY